MANLGFYVTVLVVCVVAGMCGDVLFVGGQCQGDFRELVAQCATYVQKSGPRVPPSPGCCNVIKTVDVPCICGHMTKEVEQIISMDKAVYCASYCGKPLPHGSKCGTFTIP